MLTGGGFEAVWNAQASVRRSIGCPSAREVGPGKSVIQYYRNGALLFWNLDSENTIYILIGDAAGAWQRYDAGTLDPRTVQYTCEPRGITPVRSFAKLLATEPALVERLGDGGCATTPEQGYLATREQFDQGIMLFLDIPLESGQRPFWVFSGSDRGAFTKYTR